MVSCARGKNLRKISGNGEARESIKDRMGDGTWVGCSHAGAASQPSLCSVLGRKIFISSRDRDVPVVSLQCASGRSRISGCSCSCSCSCMYRWIILDNHRNSGRSTPRLARRGPACPPSAHRDPGPGRAALACRISRGKPDGSVRARSLPPKI